MYLFSITKTKPAAADARRWNRIAKKHGGRYVEVNRRRDSVLGINHGQYQGWFEIPNRGAPFDAQTAAAVMEEIGNAR
jgi:hypothetical protein